MACGGALHVSCDLEWISMQQIRGSNGASAASAASAASGSPCALLFYLLLLRSLLMMIWTNWIGSVPSHLDRIQDWTSRMNVTCQLVQLHVCSGGSSGSVWSQLCVHVLLRSRTWTQTVRLPPSSLWNEGPVKVQVLIVGPAHSWTHSVLFLWIVSGLRQNSWWLLSRVRTLRAETFWFPH